MNGEEKTTLALFLDLAGDYLKDGYKRDRQYTPGFFPDDAVPSSLPLAYQVDEDEHDEYTNEPFDSPELKTNDIDTAIRNCRACALATVKKNAVPGEGALHPLVMVIGEGPGADEDSSGRPFVGKAGQLLDKMLASIELSRETNCFIANMVKCRPPGNRDPDPSEITACFPFLKQQIALLRPRIILCAGRVAAQNLLSKNQGINSLRGEFFSYENIPVLCTFHPSAILRDESLKRPAWEDLKLLRAKLNSSENDA